MPVCTGVLRDDGALHLLCWVDAENADHQLPLAGGSSSYHSAKTEDSESSFLYLLRYHVPSVLLLEAATLYFLEEICRGMPLPITLTLSYYSASQQSFVTLLYVEK